MDTMGTKFAAYNLKLTCLHEYYQRLLHGTQPTPSGIDMANTVKYFAQTLLSLLKEVCESPLEMIKNQSLDHERMALYPNLDYKQLYNALTQLMDVVPLIHVGLQAFGQAILQCLACLLPFLDHDLIDNVPYLTASAMSVLPVELHQEVVNHLCFYILPFTIGRKNEDRPENFASQSVAAVIMMVFQYSTNPAHHCQLLECLMGLKSEVVKDLLCVIAYGTASARASAAKLLFYYWPTFNQNLFDRRSVLVKFANDLTPFVCQRDMCPNAGNAEAGKVCYDHRISITFANDSPPPLYLCIECANEIHRKHPNQNFYDILHSMQQVSMVCENKNCRATDKSAISVCFSTECASYNGNHPIRYCLQCHNIRHNNRRGGDHVFHMALSHVTEMDPQMQTYLVQSIVSLLKEAEPIMMDSNREQFESSSNKGSSYGGLTSNRSRTDPTSLEDRQMLGRYGVWLLIGLCTPNQDTPIEMLGRLLSMLFHWFHVTAYSFDGQAESALEKLKTEYVCGWLSEVMKTHYHVFISCLLPHPADYVRVGGHWETLASRTSHLKDGLNRLFCLVPYEVITSEIWDHVMPYWMEAMVNDVPQHELQELKIILCKILDPDMSPLGFDAKKMYNFVAKRFINTSAQVQEQALNWLQTLTILQIMIPLTQLFAMFSDGVSVIQTAGSSTETADGETVKIDDELIFPVTETSSDKSTHLSDDMASTPRNCEFTSSTELNLSCYILMLDVLLKQMELQDIERHTGINTWICRDACRLMKMIMSTNWINGHECSSELECTFCESRIIWHQLCLQLLEYMVPENLAHPPDNPIDETSEDQGRKSPPETSKKSDSKSDVVLNMPISEVHSVGGVLVHMPHFFEQIMTATVETVSEQLDLTAIMPTEKVMSAVARAVTLSDTDVATATVSVAKPHLVGEDDQPLDEGENDMEDFWHTSVGKFRFNIEDLPEQLQYIHKLLKELMSVDKPEIQYYMLQCLNMMCLYGDALATAIKDHHGFFIWCQENLLIKNLWELLSSEHSHIAQMAVPLLLHCVTQPSGTDTFWRLVQEEFHNSDWRVRFLAVDRATLIARFMDSTPLRNVTSLQAALANIFCYLINSMDDSNVLVAQRATLYLGTVHDTAIRSLIMCLETQFDSVIVDRPMILQTLYQLHNSLSDRRILSWDFFLNRFDALFLEAQINLEKSGDISCLRDLRNTDMNSEAFMRKIHRAQEALSASDGSGTSSVKTLSASFGTKWPYKRTMSAPASMVPRQDTKQEKEKIYNRQYSAPILKRKSSRFGLDGHLHSLNIVDEAGNLQGFTHKIIDLEEADKETMHLLVFLLMQFLSRQDQAYPTDEKPVSRTQGIVLRHLYLLLGYNQTERTFHTSPIRLRNSSVFTVFIANLPQLLDQNYTMSLIMIPPILSIMQHCPCPNQGSTVTDHQPPSYSLWYLEPHIRRSWLMSLLVILYKGQYGQQPWCNQLQTLVRIVLNTLDNQFHQCKRIPAIVVMGGPPSKSRDHDSGNAVGDIETENMPIISTYQRSPGGHGQFHMKTHWEDSGFISHYSKKHSSYSINADSTESELAAIPESPKSDSTLQESSNGSFGEIEDSGAVVKKAQLGKALSIATGDNRAKLDLKTRPNWFLGSEDDSQQKKWSVHEGVKMMVHNAFWSGQTSLNKVPPFTDSNKIAKPDHPHLFSISTNVSPGVEQKSVLQRARSDGPELSSLGQKQPKQIEQSKPLDSPSSSGHVTTTTSSDLSSSPASSQLTNVEGSQHLSWTNAQKLTAPNIERLLPIGNTTPRTVSAQRGTVQKVVKGKETYGSPESPLSKMDVMSANAADSSFEQDSETCLSSDVTSSHSVSQLELPMPERLLPVGPQRDQVSSLVEDVRHILSAPENQAKQTGIYKDELQNVKQDSVTSENAASESLNPASNANEMHSSRSTSPRKLIKQVALESPPPNIDCDDFCSRIIECDRKNRTNEQMHLHRDKTRKMPATSMHRATEGTKHGEFWPGLHSQRNFDFVSQQACHADFNLKQSLFRIGDDCIYDRCSECGTIKEEYSDEDLGLCIITLGTFIHREPAMAAPLLPEILSAVTKMALNSMYPWQNETNLHLPGGAISVAHQFLRCVLHQLAPNGVFMQMFQTHINESTRMQFFKSVTLALIDFNELNPIAPLQLLLETLNAKKSLPIERLAVILHNVACYLDCLPLEAGLGPGTVTWSGLIVQFDGFFRRIVLVLSSLEDITPLLRIMVSVLKVPGIQQSKGMLDPFSKVLSYAVQNCILKYSFLTDLCYLCHRGFTRDRDKHFLSRTIVYELVQAVKFKTTIPDTNFLLLLHFVLQDVGGVLPTTIPLEEINIDTSLIYNTNASESLRSQLADIVDFLVDFHTMGRIKSYNKGMQSGLNEDTLGGTLKCGLAQYLALEITRGNNRENRAISRYLPWLYSAPSMLQQGVREYTDCVSHVRLLSWLLLGSLTYTTMCSTNNAQTHNPTMPTAQPIPQEGSCHIADHIQVILSGFPEQCKASVPHMSSLFHAFILCQLWTVYLEEISVNNSANTDNHNLTMNILLEFWGKVTPCILQLIQTKTLAEMMSLHFMSLLEALLECRSIVLNKLLPMWNPILFSNHIQLPNNLQMRLQNCRDFSPNQATDSPNTKQDSNAALLRWLRQLQFKMAQIEIQSSTVTQFYSI